MRISFIRLFAMAVATNGEAILDLAQIRRAEASTRLLVLSLNFDVKGSADEGEEFAHKYTLATRPVHDTVIERVCEERVRSFCPDALKQFISVDIYGSTLRIARAATCADGRADADDGAS